MPMNFNSDDVEDGAYVNRATGRRDEPSRCYGCGEDIPDGARDCGRPVCRERVRRAQRRPDAWLVEDGTR